MTIDEYLVGKVIHKDVTILRYNPEEDEYMLRILGDYEEEYKTQHVLNHIRNKNKPMYSELKRLFPEELV